MGGVQSRLAKLLLAVLLLALLLFSNVLEGAFTSDVFAAEVDEDFFESKIRPVLTERCMGCHGAKKQWASLRLDSRDGMMRGGDSGPAISSSEPLESELIRRINSDDPEFRMPPQDSGPALTAAQRDALRVWISSGAAWPKQPMSEPGDRAMDPASHWAFQPLAIPSVSEKEGTGRTVDAWIDSGLRRDSLPSAAIASRRERLRRACYAITGLPPTADEVRTFEMDSSPDAWQHAVDRLLADKAYGERWGRVWLDVARYSDTKGYVYGREERTFVFAPAYRDWVINAFNEDLPYDRFVLLQLAADQLVDKSSPDLAAMGFLTLGRRFLAIPSDIIEDRIDTVFRGLMGLTVGCSRCHDHKFDPIPTEDYYSLYGVFQSGIDQRVSLDRNLAFHSAEFLTGLEDRRQKLKEVTAVQRSEANARIQSRFKEYLLTQTQMEKYPEGSFNQLSTKEDLIPALVHRWEWFLALPESVADPRLRVWNELSRLPADEFTTRAAEVLQRLRAEEGACHPTVLAMFETTPASIAETAERYGQLVDETAKRWKEESEARIGAGEATPRTSKDASLESLRALLIDVDSPFYIPDEPIDSTEWYWDNGTCVEIWKAQGELDRWLLQATEHPPEIGIMVDRPLKSDGRIFRRGDPNQKGRSVPRRFLSLVSGPDRTPFAHGSGRLEMAQEIVSKKNPLTARVWVNRVWQQLFGAGLVKSASDFGMRCDAPSHPELLDDLALRFMEHDWSTRWLVRELLMSEAYQRSSDVVHAPIASVGGGTVGVGAVGVGTVGVGAARQPSEVDPENRMLWRTSKQRLTWEQMRDSFLVSAGKLDARLGGKSVDAFALLPNGTSRRSIYTTIDRQYLPLIFQMFDFANPDLHTPVRLETTVPQQGLFLLNHPLVAACSQSIASRLDREYAASTATDQGYVEVLYRHLLQRSPSPDELAIAVAFLKESAADLDASVPQDGTSANAGQQLKPRELLAQVILISNEAIFLD
jgi:hypothetical protein